MDEDVRNPEMACELCDDRENIEGRRYIESLLYIQRLKTAGLTFDTDDFPLSFWLDLGILMEYLENRRLQQVAMALWGGAGKEE